MKDWRKRDKEKQRINRLKYEQSEKGKVTRKCWRKSPAGILYDLNYAKRRAAKKRGEVWIPPPKPPKTPKMEEARQTVSEPMEPQQTKVPQITLVPPPGVIRRPPAAVPPPPLPPAIHEPPVSPETSAPPEPPTPGIKPANLPVYVLRAEPARRKVPRGPTVPFASKKFELPVYVLKANQD